MKAGTRTSPRLLAYDGGVAFFRDFLLAAEMVGGLFAGAGGSVFPYLNGISRGSGQ